MEASGYTCCYEALCPNQYTEKILPANKGFIDLLNTAFGDIHSYWQIRHQNGTGIPFEIEVVCGVMWGMVAIREERLLFFFVGQMKKAFSEEKSAETLKNFYQMSKMKNRCM